MKYLLIILLCMSSIAYGSQTVSFLGNFSIDGVGTDADSAWLFMFYYGERADSVKVTAHEAEATSGLYAYKYTCSSDSAMGWSGLWCFFENTNSIVVTDFAHIALAPDSIVADTNQAWASTASDTNSFEVEDIIDSFRVLMADSNLARYSKRVDYQSSGDTASSFATFTQVDSVFDTLIAASARVGDVEKFSGDAAAADNLETMLDGTGGQQFTLKKLKISGANGALGSFEVSNTSGPGGFFVSSSNNVDHSGLRLYSIYGDGLRTQGGVYGANLLGDTKDLMATIDLDDLSGDLDHANFEADYYSHVADSIRTIFNDSIPALLDSIYSIQDSLYRVLDSLYAIMDSLATQSWPSVDPCAGIGTYSCSLIVLDTSKTPDVVVPGMKVTQQNQAEDATPNTLTTNSNGLTVFGLDNGDYRYLATGGMYVFGTTDFTVADAARKDTLMCTSPTITEAGAPNLCTVYGYWRYADNDTLKSADYQIELYGTPVAVDTSVGLTVMGCCVTGRTDGNGYLEVGLIKNGNLIDGDSIQPYYHLSISHSIPDLPTDVWFFIPVDSSTMWLTNESEYVTFTKPQ